MWPQDIRTHHGLVFSAQVGRPGVSAQLSKALVMWCWASHLAASCLSLPICNNGNNASWPYSGVVRIHSFVFVKHFAILWQKKLQACKLELVCMGTCSVPIGPCSLCERVAGCRLHRIQVLKQLQLTLTASVHMLEACGFGTINPRFCLPPLGVCASAGSCLIVPMGLLLYLCYELVKSIVTGVTCKIHMEH